MPDFLSISWWRKVYQRLGRAFGVGCGVVFAVPLVIGFGWNQFAGRNQDRSANQVGTIATVNGDPITNAQYQAAIPNRGGSPEQFAETRGAVIEQLEQMRIAQQIARKYNVHVPDADIDRKLATEREKLGKSVNDDQWSDYVARAHQGVTPAEYRDTLATDPQLLVTGLLNKLKEKETISPEDIQQYKAEVQMNLVQIGFGADPFQDPKKKTVPLTEADAKKKAEDLLAKAKSGQNVADIAKANSTDFTAKQGGDTGFLPEYKNKSLEQSYGKAFADEVHKTATGQLTGVVQTSMFGRKGFAFAKIVARRDTPAAPADPKKSAATPPATTDPKKIIDELKQQRASEKLESEFKADIKTAKLVFTADGAEAKTYYDYYKLKDMQNKEMQAKMGGQFGQPAPDDPPKPGDIERQQALINSELDALYRKNPQDANLALLLAGTIKKSAQIAQGAEKRALETRLIQLYETALKGVEDRNVRFDLAELYRNQGDTANAAAQYKKIGHLMDIAPGFDTASLREEQFARKRLVTGFRALNKEAEASAEQQKYDALTLKIAEAQRKEEMERRLQSAPGMGGMVPPGGSKTIEAPAPGSARPGKAP